MIKICAGTKRLSSDPEDQPVCGDASAEFKVFLPKEKCQVDMTKAVTGINFLKVPLVTFLSINLKDFSTKQYFHVKFWYKVFDKVAKGPFIYYVITFLGFLDPPPSYVSMFLVLRIGKNWHFLTPPPPLQVLT